MSRNGDRVLQLSKSFVSAWASAKSRPTASFAPLKRTSIRSGSTVSPARRTSRKTTKLYDQTADTVTVDEIERIVI